jgi:alpha-amylase/alpha-mannosidase (GH57 family)
VAKKYVIIHGHFYQPPRENPWIDQIETQESAAPYHDWNERVYDECYRPNAYSRLLDANGTITDIHNNYRSMSFNFGPTLFSWLEQRHVATARRIVDADAASAAALDGHGNALAQVFNHIIMPLSSRRDQLTQIRWAKHYFRERFRRDPEGMWLAETAINMETVKCLIEENIKFVVLSPAQAEAFRPLDSNAPWTGAQHGLDIRHGAYRVYPTDQSWNRLPGFLDVFFFDQPLSREASFGDLLKDAHVLANRINTAFDKGSSADQAVVLATDGETFGHHKPFGDMCLAYFFRKIAPTLDITPVNFGYFLAHHPPRNEVLLKNAFGEGTAWSCSHGVGRWARDCGCTTGGEPLWKQQWRTPLRAAIKKLQEEVDREYEQRLAAEHLDPWALRDAYLQVFDDPSLPTFCRFLEQHSGGAKFTKEKALAVRKLLEAQKYMLYAYTSCAWFFSDIGGLEAMQNLAYAVRALQMGIGRERQPQALQEFCAGLEPAKSNVPGTTGKSLLEHQTLHYLAHEKILAFTAAVEKTIALVRTEKVRLFHFDVGLRQLCEIESGLLSYHGFEVAVENEMTGEQSRWAVLVSHRERAEVRGWVVAADAFGKKLTGGVEPEMWMQHPEAQSLTLMNIFQTSRENMAEYIHQNIFKDTYTKYSAWMQKNEQELDFLSRLNFPMPPYCLAPLSFVYYQQWNHLIRQLEHRGDDEEVATRLRELSKMQEQYKIVFDLKEGAALLERIIIMELSALALRLSAETCARIEYLLNIIDRFKLPVSKHKMEDIFAPVVAGPIKSLRDEVARSGEAKDVPAGAERERGDKRALLQSLVNFARRMNFNIDALKV